jgi:hypothetical protein
MPEEVLKFVEEQLLAMLERPRMYALTPEAFENRLDALNLVREFITRSMLPNTKPGSEIADFLIERGYGSASIVERNRIDGRNTAENDLFGEVVEVWREFLNRPGCLKSRK